ncbi:MAG: hypothetical protein V4677_11690 [Bacteroidota bacterium]
MKTITEFLFEQLKSNAEHYIPLFIISIICLRQYFIIKRTSHNEKVIKRLFNDNIVVKSIDEKGKIELDNTSNRRVTKRKLTK